MAPPAAASASPDGVVEDDFIIPPVPSNDDFERDPEVRYESRCLDQRATENIFVDGGFVFAPSRPLFFLLTLSPFFFFIFSTPSSRAPWLFFMMLKRAFEYASDFMRCLLKDQRRRKCQKPDAEAAEDRSLPTPKKSFCSLHDGADTTTTATRRRTDRPKKGGKSSLFFFLSSSLTSPFHHSQITKITKKRYGTSSSSAPASPGPPSRLPLPPSSPARATTTITAVKTERRRRHHHHHLHRSSSNSASLAASSSSSAT